MNLPKQLCQWLKQRQSTLCHRQLLVITGQEEWAVRAAKSVSTQCDAQSVLWIGDAPSGYVSINIKDYRSKLGHEYEQLVLNAYSGFRANATMALSGTVKAQGLMILLCPDLDTWPEYDDPEKNNRISFGFNQQDTKSQFFRYLASTFTKDDSVAILTDEQFSGSLQIAEEHLTEHNFEQQNTAIHGIKRVAQGHRNRPLVLTADRGRGKSSALGMAAAKLMLEGIKDICVTSLHTDSTQQIFDHAQQILPTAKLSKNTLTYETCSLTFKPIDQLLELQDNIHLVLVDEAASLPIHQLMQLAHKFPRIVFSSTIHGYEGSGRGFEMRFIKQLSQVKPDFKRIHMTQPIRWYEQDPLEQFWFNTFFQSEQPSYKPVESNEQGISCQYVSKTQLLNNTALLGDIFKLLINAHYQTSQDDLQRFLDAPEISCFTITKGKDLLGVAQIVEEGGNSLAELASNITDCSRRVKGHLVAQNIASSYNNKRFLLASQWRIGRIAIAIEYQRKGLGQQLIQYIEQQATQQNIQFLTTSFGCNTEVLPFWYKRDFRLTKLSAKPEISSGEHSAICLKPLTSKALTISKPIKTEFFQELLYQMDKHLKSMPEAILMQILQLEAPKPISSFEHMPIIEQFALGKRAYSTCKRQLKAYLLANPSYLSKAKTADQMLLVAAILQNLADEQLCIKFKLNGKKQIEQHLKNCFAQLLSATP